MHDWQSIAMLSILGVYVAVVAVIDARTYRIPDALTLPVVVALVALLLLTELQLALVRVGFASLVLCALLILGRISRGGFGMGDAKLMAALSLGLPPMAWLLVCIAGLLLVLCALFAAVAVPGFVWIFAKQLRVTKENWRGYSMKQRMAFARRLKIPLAPFLAVGFGAMLLLTVLDSATNFRGLAGY